MFKLVAFTRQLLRHINKVNFLSLCRLIHNRDRSFSINIFGGVRIMVENCLLGEKVDLYPQVSCIIYIYLY